MLFRFRTQVGQEFLVQGLTGFFFFLEVPSNIQACKLLELRQLLRNMLLGRRNWDELLNILPGGVAMLLVTSS